MTEITPYDYYDVVTPGTADERDYIGETYQQSGIISSWHSLGRGGNTDDVSSLNSEDIQEYINGALITSILLLIFIVIWGGIIIFLRIYDDCIPGKIKFLSGWRFENTSGTSLMPFIVRITFICCAICVYIFTIVYVQKGIHGFDDAKKIAQAQNTRFRDVVEEADRVIITMLANGEEASGLKDRIKKNIPYLCPKRNITNLGTDFMFALNEYQYSLDQLGDFYIDQRWKPAEVWVERLLNTTVKFEDTVDDINLPLFAIHWIPLIVLTTILLIATLLSIYDNGQEDLKIRLVPWFQWCLKKIVFPLFTLWSIGTFFLAAAVAFGLVVNSDLCAGGPNGGSPDFPFMRLVDSSGFNGTRTGGAVYKFIKYYTRGCNKRFRDKGFTFYEGNLTRALDQTEYITDFILDKGTIELSEDCGNDVTGLMVALDELQTHMQYLKVGTRRIRDVLRCERLNNIYTELFYNGLCYHSVYALAWSYYSLLAIGLFSMLMVTLRSSILPSYEYSWSEEFDIDGDNASDDQTMEEDSYELESNTMAFPAIVRMISGCQDSQTSADVSNVASFSLPDPAGRAGGACTSALLKVLYSHIDSSCEISWEDLLIKMREMLNDDGYKQIPQLTSSRPTDLKSNFELVPSDGSATGAKRALLIAINYVGQKGELTGCINDALNMKKYIMDIWGFEDENITMIMDDGEHMEPTRENILNAYNDLVIQSEAGDSIFCHYSGHGGKLRDDDGDEGDGYDETLVPVDFARSGQIRDDDLYESLVGCMPRGVYMTCLMDCCHSGTVLDLPYKFVAPERRKK